MSAFDRHWEVLVQKNPKLESAVEMTLSTKEFRRLLQLFYRYGEETIAAKGFNGFIRELQEVADKYDPPPGSK